MKKLGGRAYISIHSLFAEGDIYRNPGITLRYDISIHSLFAEGDVKSKDGTHKPVISIHSLFAEGDSKNAQKYLLLTYILHTKPTITQANPSLKLIFSNLFSKLTPFSREMCYTTRTAVTKEKGGEKYYEQGDYSEP